MSTDPVSVRRTPGQVRSGNGTESNSSEPTRFVALAILAGILRFSAAVIAILASVVVYGRIVVAATLFAPIRDFGADILFAIGVEIAAELILLALQIEKNTRK